MSFSALFSAMGQHADAYTEVCADPASAIEVKTNFHVTSKEFERFAIELRRFAETEGFVYGPSASANSSSGQLDVLLVARGTGEAIHVQSARGEETTADEGLITAEMAECRNDTQTPWLPYWTKFYHFVQRFKSKHASTNPSK